MDREFWKLTWRKFDALLRRREHDLYLADLRVAIAGSTIANHLRAEGSEPLTPADLMPMHKDKFARTRQTPEEQLAIIKVMHQAFGGNMDEFEKNKPN